MDTVNFLEEWKRMCANADSCEKCDVKSFCMFWEGDGAPCSLQEPKRLVEAVYKWSTAHPRKTRLQDLLEKFPKAMLNKQEVFDTCVCKFGYEEKFCNGNCEDCWKKPIE